MINTLEKTSGRSLCIGKTDELTQMGGESSSQCVSAFPIKKPAETACRSGCATTIWLSGQSRSFRRTRSFASFGSAPKEGEQGYSPDRNKNSPPQKRKS